MLKMYDPIQQEIIRSIPVNAEVFSLGIDIDDGGIFVGTGDSSTSSSGMIEFIDPINESSYSNFFPYGYNSQRKNALSLGTLSLERHRLLWLYLKNETSFFQENNKILHVAPEQCYYSFFKKYFKNYVTVDLDSPLAEYKADVCDMPFESNSFDFILCNHVLEHVYDDDLAINELRRVLKNNGVAILQVPLDLKLKNTIDGRDINNLKKR